MEELGFVCAWGAKNRETSWSGTPYGLYSHFGSFFEVIDIDVGDNRTVFHMLKNKITRRIKRLVHFNDMDMSAMHKREHIVKKIIGCKNFPLIQFDECPFSYQGLHYIYQDLHVDYVKKLAMEEPEIFKVSGFQHLKLDSICKREQYQRYFYQNVDGIFTMGRWLAKELVDNYGIPAEKVFHVGGGVNIDIKLIDYSQKKGNKILFVGRDFERKNGNLVVEAFRLTKEKFPNLELYIAGPKNLNISGGGGRI